MRSWLVGTSFIVILSLVAVVPGFADDPSKDPFYTQGVSKDAPPINTVTEHVDPFSGILTLSHTDVQLPGNGGLDMKLVRSYNSMIWGRTDVYNPGLVAINELSPLGYGWTMHMGIVRNHTGNGSSNRYLPNNPVVEMPDGSKHTLYVDQRTGQMVSKEFWLYKKLLNGVSELYLPDGTVYTFESSGNTGYSVQDGGTPVAIAQCTKIQNAAKNSTITISYERNNGYPYLKTITDSAGRTVTLNYNYAQHRLTSVSYDGKTINYAYNGTGLLQSVAPPVGNAWTYSYDGMHELNVLNYPTGGRISYTYGNVSFATGAARVYFKVVTSRSTSGRGIPAGTWTYGYSSGGSSGDVTTINGPGVTEVHAFHGWGNNSSGNVWRIGLPMRKEYNGAFSYLETYSWVKGSTVSYDQTSNAGWTGTLGYVWDSGISVPFLAAKSINRDGRTYTTSYSNYDYYGNPQTISESGDVDRTRTLTYWSNAERNIVQGKPATEVVTGDFPGTDSTTHTYDASSGNVTQINRNGVITRYGYNANGNLSSITDANNHQKTYLWSNGRMSRETNAFYQVSRQINASGTIRSETNGRNNTTSYTYDNNLRLTRITPPIGNPTTLSYPADSSSRTETRGGYSIVHSFDGFGRPTGSHDSKGISTSIAYTAYGTKDSTDSSIGDRTSFDYFGRPRQVTHKDGETITYSYSGSTVTVTDEDQGTTVLTYRAFGNPDERYLMGVTDQASKTASYSRNVLGLLTSIAQEGANRTYGYSSKYFLSSESNPETGTITYGRDNVGNLTSKADSAGTKTYAYDSIDRLTSVASGGTSLSYGYDNADNRISMLSPSATISYVYDAANRLTTKNETMAGRTYATTYGYDGNDNITTMTYPSGRVVTVGYNGNNQVTSIPGFVTGVSYSTSGTTAGLPTSFSSANGITTSMSYNSRQAVTAISAGSALSLGYGYDSRGNTTSMANHLDSSKSQSYSYDSLSRLTGFNGAWGSGSFRYDAIGNRTSKTVAGVATTYGYAGNRLVSTSGGELATYSYNGNGALASGTWGGASHSLAYDRFDNLSSFSSGATVLASFGYDGDGMRVVKISSGKEYVYHHDQGGMVISEDDGRGNLLADYVYLNGKLVARVSPEGPPPATPAAPTALAATAASSSAINLSWTDNSTNETGFAIERKTGATGTYAQVATVGANIRTYSNTGLAANTNYYYRVRAVNGTVYSSYSNEANATTRPATPAAPTVLAATAASSSAINLSWTDNSTNETGFAIERKTGATGTYAQIATVAANVRTYSNAGLAANTNYYYRVRAVNGTVYSSYSNEANATTRPATPAAPTVLAASTTSSSAINLSWTDNSTNETGFAIERKTGATGTYAQIATVGANVRTYANTGLAANTNYYYRVRAVNGTVYSSYSNEANATTRTAAPAAPTALAASVTSSSAINLSWTDNSTNETGFAIERKTGATGTYAQIATVGANVRTYSNTGLAANTNYYYRVRAVNGTVYSSYSNEANATTRPATPAAPSALAATAASSSVINLSWTDNASNETGFAIERKTGATGTYAQVATVGANIRTYANTGLVANTAYYYRVRAVNGTVYSSYSNEANAKTNIASFTIPLYRWGTSFGYGCRASNDVAVSSGCSGAPIGYISASAFSGAIPLYRGGTTVGTSCIASSDLRTSPVSGCSPAPVGYISTSKFSGSVSLYRGSRPFGYSCRTNDKVSISAGCLVTATPFGYMSSTSGSH